MNATVTSKGQVTLPAEARRRLGMKPGTKLEITIKDNRLEVKVAGGSIRDLKGFLPKPKKSLTLEEMDEAIGRAVVERNRCNR